MFAELPLQLDLAELMQWIPLLDLPEVLLVWEMSCSNLSGLSIISVLNEGADVCSLLSCCCGGGAQKASKQA